MKWICRSDLQFRKPMCRKESGTLSIWRVPESVHETATSCIKPQLFTCDMPSMSSWMRSVWLYCRMARPTRKIISKPYRQAYFITEWTQIKWPHMHPQILKHTLIVCPTSYMKISKIRVATGRGRKVRKRVRNQDDAYMDVWKLWDRKWTFSSGSCS